MEANKSAGIAVDKFIFGVCLEIGQISFLLRSFGRSLVMLKIDTDQVGKCEV